MPSLSSLAFCSAIVSTGTAARQKPSLAGDLLHMGQHTHHNDPWHLSRDVKHSFWDPDETSLHPSSFLQTSSEEEEPVQIHYVNGFFGPLAEQKFPECDVPCMRSHSPGPAAAQADVLVSFPIEEVPPTNGKSALAVAHSMESLHLYGGNHIHNYKYTATTALSSTIPWVYFNWKNFEDLQKRRTADSVRELHEKEFPPFEARFPRAVFVAKDCHGTERNALLEKLGSRGVPIDAISSCNPPGTLKAEWPQDVPRTDKLSALKRYRMYMAVENTIEEGYVTEKVMDGYAASTLNIYLGAPDADAYLPKHTFIMANDAMVGDDPDKAADELAEKIKKALNDKDTWESYFKPMDEPIEQWNGGDYKAKWEWSKEDVSSQCRLCRLAKATKEGKQLNKFLQIGEAMTE